MFKPSMDSLVLLQAISERVSTFHHHAHILYDIAKTFPDDKELRYLEIGCYAGATSCLMLQRPKTSVFALDLGWPVDMNIALRSMEDWNIHKNSFQYIKGNSHDPEIVNLVFAEVGCADILFIDGDHSFDGVSMDHHYYRDLVPHGGYIVFDDYSDPESPEVHKAVDFFTKFNSDYEIIGTLENVLGAYPATLTTGNCFVVYKK